MERLATGALPNLVVLGVSNCGTSALHYYLDLHPEIQMSSPKELNFFVSDDDVDIEPFVSNPRERATFGAIRNWSRGLDWYAAHFDPAKAVRGESSVSYSAPWYPGVAERMAGVVPDARLILMVRDPVERLVSQHMHRCSQGYEWRSLSEAVSNPRNVYIPRSRYASALRPFLDRFSRERIHIATQEDLLGRRRATMREVFRFLGVDDSFWSPKMERLRNRSGVKGRRFRLAQRFRRSRATAPLYQLRPEAKWWIERLVASGPTAAERPRVPMELRRRLVELLEPDTAELEGFTGWDLSAWRAVQSR